MKKDESRQIAANVLKIPEKGVLHLYGKSVEVKALQCGHVLRGITLQ